MSTPHVILALLEIQPATGYELSNIVKMSVEPLWSATHSQIYPALRKLEYEGFVKGEDGVRGHRLRKTVYTITNAGLGELTNWINSPVNYLPFRDPFRLVMAYMDSAEQEAVVAHIERHIELQTKRAEELEDRASRLARGEHPLITARIERLGPEELERVKLARSTVLAELAALARFEVESAKRLRAAARWLNN